MWHISPFYLSQHIQETRLFVRCIDIDQKNSCTTFRYFEQTNRMLDRYGKDSFIIFDFSKKVEAATARKILRGGIIVNGDEYQFIGCSSKGLKERTCYMFRGSCCDVNRHLEECGSFSSIKSRYKRLKRIGLLFSSATPTQIEIADDNVKEVADIETDGGNFTDGCGAVNMVLAAQLRAKCKCVDDYYPAVFQIRYQGCKGVVMIDHNLKEDEQLVIRPSMKKFNPGTKPFRQLWLCDHSRPYTFGYLNRQFITLLSSLGVKDEVFLRIQSEHFTRLENVLRDPKAAFEMLLLDNQPELASHCASVESLNTFSSQLSKLKTRFVSKLEKLRLPVLKSRNVFGVFDPVGKLKYGQCYFRYTEQGKCKTLLGRVVLAKNPCYLLGDVRVLTAVNIDGLDNLIDCIVFPTQGERPHPSEIAGSDLDGDQYFVCWDEDLVVLCVEEPYDYPSEDIPETSDKVTLDALIDYFSSQRNNMGKIDSYYKYWANREGAGCSECVSLGKLFSRSVDATKTGDVVSIPHNLKPPPLEVDSRADSHSEASMSPGTCSHVWMEMEKRATEKKQALSEDIVCRTDVEMMGEEFIWSLLTQKVPNLSEFQLLRLIQRWCAHQAFPESDKKLLEFTRHINFGEFTVDQQVEAIDTGIPLKIVTNALNKSILLPQSLLQTFLLDDPHRSWRFYFSSTSAEFKWNYLLRGLQRHPQSMVIIKLQDEVTFALHFLSPPQLGETVVGGGSVVAYFSSRLFNLDLQYVLGSEFKLNLTEDTLQLFRGKTTATFLWLSSEQPSRRQGKQTNEPDILFDRISVDLTRFKGNILRACKHPKVNKQNFLSIEMFVRTTNFKMAYMDITEADVQDDYPVEETAVTNDIEDLPSDPEEDQEINTPIEIPDSYSRDAMLAVLTRSAQKGYYLSFQKALESILSKDSKDAPQLIPALLELLTTMVKKYCHKHLSDETVSCLQIIVTSLYPYINTPMQLLELLSHSGQLGVCSLIEQAVDHILPNLCASQSLDQEYISVTRKWKLWYFIPPKLAVKLSRHFYTLYTSLCNQVTISQQCSNQPLRDISTTSLLENEFDILMLASNMGNTVALQQHNIDGYVTHFSHLIFDHLLCEMFNLQNQGERVCDTSSCIVRLSGYEHKHSHSASSEPDNEEGEMSKTSWRVGFARPTKDIASNKFTIGSYVAVNLMKKQGSPLKVVCVPVAIGHIVHVTRHPADIVIDVSEPVPLCLKRSAHCSQGHWQLTLIGNVTSFDRSLKALKALRDTPACTALLPLLVQSPYKETRKTAGDSSESQANTDRATCIDSSRYIFESQAATDSATSVDSSRYNLESLATTDSATSVDSSRYNLESQITTDSAMSVDSSRYNLESQATSDPATGVDSSRYKLEPQATTASAMTVHKSGDNTECQSETTADAAPTVSILSGSTESQTTIDLTLLTCNSSQQKAVCSSLKQRLTLIHGPPGTGKTHVACGIVQQQLSRDKHNSVLVLAETNLAVDNLSEKFMSLGIHVVRIGKLDHIAPHVRSISLEGQIEKRRVQEGKEKRKSPFLDKKMAKLILNAAQVVATTCTSAGDPNLKGMKFPFIIIDEATQVTEPTLLIPLVHGCQQLTLIGDPEQLAPSLPVPPKSLDSDLLVGKLSVTLFHRLQKVLPSIFLIEQHRMHPELAAFPSRKFYGGRVLTAKCRSQQQPVFQEEIPILERNKPLVFINVSETENHIGTSFCNTVEATAVAKIITYLINHKVSTQQMTILTPYLGQLKSIHEECQKQKIHCIKAHTIDSFQGREADVIIFSTVRCNPRGELGFLKDKYRMNVLLTRARHGLIGIGCKKTLSEGSDLWKEWLENVRVIEGSRLDGRDSSYNRSGGGAQREQLGVGSTRTYNTDTSKQSRSGGRYSSNGGRSASRPRSPESFGSLRGHGRTKDDFVCDDQTQRRGYGMRGHRRGGSDRSSSYYHGRREGAIEEHWSAGATRGQRSNRVPNRGRLSRTRGRGRGRYQ